MSYNRESDILADVRLKAQAEGCTTFRNSTGQLKNEHGRWVRFGLCVGSSDVIGWTKYKIKPEDVGRTVAVFTAFETKAPKGIATDDQIRFVGHVMLAGGIAAICRSATDAIMAINEWRTRGSK